jgi:hypothetical protein
MPARVHVFAGPTVSGREIRTVLPDAVVHPPVAAGDLSALPAGAGDMVVILDGLMAGGRAVRHKEILGLLDGGVEVWGAGGLGALRAAELHDQGMHAHGRIARLVLRGVLDGDDEVAVAHDGPEGRWTARSVALVDIRATCRQAHRRGLIDAETADAVVAAAQAMPYRHRRWDEVVGRAVDGGLDAEIAWRVEHLAREHPVRLTHDDALGCLDAVRLARAAGPRPRPRRPARRSATLFVRRWAEETSGAAQPGGGFVSDVDVLTLCRLLGVDYPAFQRRVAVRTLAVLAMPWTHATEREGQTMLRDFAEQQHLDSNALGFWLTERGLHRDELLAHLRRERAIRHVILAMGIDPRDQPAVEVVLAGVVLDHARRRGFLAARAARGWERSWLSALELEILGPEQRIAQLAARSFQNAPGADWRAPLLQELKVSGVFRVAREAVAQAKERWLDMQAADPAGAADCRDGEFLVSWFVQRWGVRDRLDLALLDRGLRSRDELAACAPMYCALDRSVTTYRDLHCLGRPAAAVA